MQNQTISLDKQQMHKGLFPINTKVDIYNDNGHSLQSFCSSGFVEGGHIDIKDGTNYELFYEVRVTCNCHEQAKRNTNMNSNVHENLSYTKKCRVVELRFSKGSPVTIQENEHSKNMKCGIVMGTVEVPNEIKLAEGPSFWYSIYVPSESKVINEVLPEKVKCDSRHLPDETIEDQPEGQDVPHIIVPHCGQSEASQLSIDKNDSDGNDLCSKVKQKTRLSPRERSTDHNNGRTNSTLSVPKIADRVEDMSISDNEQDENKLHQQSFDEKKRNIPESNDSDTHKEKQSAQKDMNTYKRQKLSETGYTNKDKYNESSPRRRNKSPSKISTCITTMADDDAETIQQSFDKDDKYEIWICNLPACHENTLKDDLQMLVNGNKVYIFEDQPAAKVKLNDQSDVDKYVAKLHNQVVLDGSKAPLRVVQKFSSSVPEDDEIKLIVENLWDDDDEEKIKSTFSEYSDVATVSLIKDINGTLKHAATVVFKDYRSKAIALRNKNALKPYNIIDPDPHSNQKARKKNEFKQTIPKTLSPSRKAVSWSTEQNLLQLSQRNENDKIVSPSKPYDNHRSNSEITFPNKQENCTNTLSPEEKYKNFQFVAEIYTQLDPNITAGYLIGPRGKTVEDLKRRTSSCIIVNDDPKRGAHCAKICSNVEFIAMNGADVVINKLILQFGNQLRCNFQLLHNGEPVKYEYISWRIHLPIMERELVGFIIGLRGDRCRQLKRELNCRDIWLSQPESNGCMIEISDDDAKKALFGTNQMLLRLREKYGDKLIDEAKVEGGRQR